MHVDGYYELATLDNEEELNEVYDLDMEDLFSEDEE